LVYMLDQVSALFLSIHRGVLPLLCCSTCLTTTKIF
jgi:hypothetical protein